MADPVSVTLVPLTVEHAEAMVEVLADPALYRVIDGQPPTVEELRARYRRQLRGGPADGSEQGRSEEWRNWIVLDHDQQPVGYVQATISTGDDDRLEAELAWVIGTAAQGRGYATAAARAAVAELIAVGIDRFSAHIQPGHVPSERVARALGLQPTTALVDGEVRWIS